MEEVKGWVPKWVVAKYSDSSMYGILLGKKDQPLLSEIVALNNSSHNCHPTLLE